MIIEGWLKYVLRWRKQIMPQLLAIQKYMLIIGGKDGKDKTLSSTELFDSIQWTMVHLQWSISATLLATISDSW